MQVWPPLLLLGVLLSACTGQVPPDTMVMDGELVDMDKRETIWGGEGITFGGADEPDIPQSGSGIGLNAFLWRASLDVVSTWPVLSADPFGGVIITDWYAPPETPDEKFKFNIFILDRVLRADGVRVSLFKQHRDSNGLWQQARVQSDTITQVENAILTRAQQFRTEALGQ